MLLFRATFWILTGIGAIWLITAGALIFGTDSFDTGIGEASHVADGSVYMAVIALVCMAYLLLTCCTDLALAL